MVLSVKEADWHVVGKEGKCEGDCDYCYLGKGNKNTPFQRFKGEEDIEKQKQIIKALFEIAGVRDLVFVGGDPCTHFNLVLLLLYAKEVGLSTCVLSNTHTYRSGGIIVPIKEVVGLLDEIDFTLHGKDGASHDAFNHSPGSYKRATGQIKQFIYNRTREQCVGIMLNMVPSIIGTPEGLYDIMRNIIIDINMYPQQDFFSIQRIAPAGRALLEWDKWKITPPMIAAAFDVFDRIRDDYGIETRVCVDAFPWCALPEKHWHYLEPLRGGCNWGQPNGTISVLPDGTLQRCALCQDDLGVNILDFKNPAEFTKFMLNNPRLYTFREKKHLSDECLNCKQFTNCGGGCVIANTDGISYGDPYGEHPNTPRRGMDYLATGF